MKNRVPTVLDRNLGLAVQPNLPNYTTIEQRG